jgi:hypothetical protein
LVLPVLPEKELEGSVGANVTVAWCPNSAPPFREAEFEVKAQLVKEAVPATFTAPRRSTAC